MMHAAALAKMTKMRDEYLSRDTPLRILDVGSFSVNGCHRPEFETDNWSYTGLDVRSGPNVDLVVGNPIRWLEIPSDSYSLVISGQTLEHTENPWAVWREMVRVVKPEGLIFITVPASGPEHKHPIDCWRFLSDGMRCFPQFCSDIAEVDCLEAGTEWGTKWCDTWAAYRKIKNA